MPARLARRHGQGGRARPGGSMGEEKSVSPFLPFASAPLLPRTPAFTLFGKLKMCFFFALLSLYPLLGGYGQDGLSLYERVVEFKGTGQDSVFKLPDPFPIEGGDSVWINDSLVLSGEFYNLDVQSREVRLARVLVAGESLRIKYRHLPLRLKRTYWHREKKWVEDDSAKEESIKIVRGSSEKSEVFGTSLSSRGSIMRGITVGTNRDLSLQSGLRMQIQGRVAKDVEVTATLSDQNTPIQPEGNTQALQEIDKVLIEIKSTNLKATLGDFNLDYEGTEFARYGRKLQGVRGEAEYQNWGLSLSGAVSRGRFYSYAFRGEEGKQGPYQLLAEDGNPLIMVLAGTERVWVDGEPMVRGEDRDYVIEYGNGQITFTRHRLITSESRIVVDYQYSDEKFKRNLYSVRANAKLWDDNLKLGTTFLQEGDDKDHPLGLVLDEEGLRRLEAAGDRPHSAYLSGADSVGDGKGYYVKVDSVNIQFFRYVGPDSGDYNVSFSFVGQGKGNYRRGYTREGYVKYSWVGPGGGSYLPIKLLPLAQGHRLMDVNLEFSPSESWQIKGEWAASDFDQNRYSPLNDGDNIGHALQVGSSYRSGGPNPGRVEFSGRVRLLGEDFREIDRTQEVEYDRRWDLTKGLSTGERVLELGGRVTPIPAIGIKGGYGRIEKTGFHSRRTEAGLGLTPEGLPHLQYTIETINSRNRRQERKGFWRRQGSSAEYQVGVFKPSLSWRGEYKTDEWGGVKKKFIFNEYGGGLGINPSKQLHTQISYTLSDSLSQPGERHAIGKTIGTLFELRRWGPLASRMEYTHRRFSLEEGDSVTTETVTDLSDLRVNYSPYQRAINSDWRYQISRLQLAKRVRRFYQVDDFQGDYSQEIVAGDTLYVPDPDGNYVLRTFSTGEYEPVVELKAQGRIRIEPGKVLRGNTGLIPIISKFSTETNLRVEEKTQWGDVWDIYLLDFDKFQSRGYTLYGALGIWQDVMYREPGGDFSLRLRYRQNKTLNNQYLSGGDLTLAMERSLRLRSRLSRKNSLEVDLKSIEKRREYLESYRPNTEFRSLQLTGNLIHRPHQSVEYGLKLEGWWDASHDIMQLFSIKPRFLYSFKGKGRLGAECERINVFRDLPFDIVGAKPKGKTWRWNLRFDYRVSRYVTAVVNYDGRREPGREIIHTGRAEIRAFF